MPTTLPDVIKRTLSRGAAEWGEECKREMEETTGDRQRRAFYDVIRYQAEHLAYCVAQDIKADYDTYLEMLHGIVIPVFISTLTGRPPRPQRSCKVRTIERVMEAVGELEFWGVQERNARRRERRRARAVA